jgi:hypothetical protein
MIEIQREEGIQAPAFARFRHSAVASWEMTQTNDETGRRIGENGHGYLLTAPISTISKPARGKRAPSTCRRRTTRGARRRNGHDSSQRAIYGETC